MPILPPTEFTLDGRTYRFPSALLVFRSPTTARRVYLALARAAGPDGVLSTPLDALAAELRLSRPLLCYYLRRLQRLRILTRLAPGGGRGHPSRWRLTLLPAGETVKQRKEKKEKKEKKNISFSHEKTGLGARWGEKMQLGVRERWGEGREEAFPPSQALAPDVGQGWTRGRCGVRREEAPPSLALAGERGEVRGKDLTPAQHAYARWLMARARAALAPLAKEHREAALTLLGRMIFRQGLSLAAATRLLPLLPALARAPLPPPSAPARTRFAALGACLWPWTRNVVARLAQEGRKFAVKNVKFPVKIGRSQTGSASAGEPFPLSTSCQDPENSSLTSRPSWCRIGVRRWRMEGRVEDGFLLRVRELGFSSRVAYLTPGVLRLYTRAGRVDREGLARLLALAEERLGEALAVDPEAVDVPVAGPFLLSRPLNGPWTLLTYPER